MRNIWKVKQGKKNNLEDVINMCNKGDTILLSPGEYHFPKGIFLNSAHKLEIRGDGENPGEVVLNGSFVIYRSPNITISNVTVNAFNNTNAINLRRGAKLELNRVVVNSDLTGENPAIWCEGSLLNIQASEIYFSKKKGHSVIFCKQSKMKMRASISDSIHAYQSNIILHHCQMKAPTILKKDTVVISTGILDFPTNRRNDIKSFMYVEAGSRVKFDFIDVNNNNKRLAFVKDSVFELKRIKRLDGQPVEIDYNSKSVVDAPKEVTLHKDRIYQRSIDSDANKNRKNRRKTTKNVKHSVKGKTAQQQRGLAELDSLHGLHDLKEKIKQFINMVKFNQMRREQGRSTVPVTLHSLFIGNPGTGKTTVARILGRTLHDMGVIPSSTFVEVTRKDLVSDYIGGTAVATQKILEKSKNGILFIDEAYALDGGTSRDFGREAINTIITFMEENRYNTMIIFAGYPDEMKQFLKMNSGLKSRIPNEFYFDDYTPEEIAEIGYSDLIKQDYVVNKDKYKNIVEWLYSYNNKGNARWVRNINEKLLITHANRVVESRTDDTQTIADADLEILMGNQEHRKEDKIKGLLGQLNELVGLDEVKQYVHRLIKEVKVDRMLMDAGDLSDKPSYHMIFSGNPGTGKTTVAHIIAQLFYHLDILPTSNVKVVDRSDLVGSYIGHTEKQTKEILELAMGGVLFIDEAYQLASTSANDFGKQAIETLLTYLENHRNKFIVILAGYTDEMERFLQVNPGLRSRIPKTIHFPDYSPEDIATIVEKNITKDWVVNVQLLRDKVIEIYKSLPSNEKANARWARNFSERLIQNHKVWAVDHGLAIDQIKKVDDEVIRAMVPSTAG